MDRIELPVRRHALFVGGPVTPKPVTVTAKPVTAMQHVTASTVTAESELMRAVPGSPCPCCGRMVRVKCGLSAAERQRRSRSRRKGGSE